MISEANFFLPLKVWIQIKKSAVKSECRNLVPIKWVSNSKEEHDGLIRLKSRSLVNIYMQVPGVYYTESFSPVATYSSTRIIIVLTLYHE